MNLRRWLIAAGAVAAATALACAPIGVTSFSERSIDLATYRTFAWDRSDTSVPGDPRLDNNTVFHDYLHDAIDRQLIAQGYEPATPTHADLLVHYHASSKQKLSISGLEVATGRCRDCLVEVYDEGTLLVDLTDARSGVLLWRGAAESGLAAVVDSQSRMETTIDRVVERIFEMLPRRL